jgi:hypothetical protein
MKGLRGKTGKKRSINVHKKNSPCKTLKNNKKSRGGKQTTIPLEEYEEFALEFMKEKINPKLRKIDHNINNIQLLILSINLNTDIVNITEATAFNNKIIRKINTIGDAIVSIIDEYASYHHIPVFAHIIIAVRQELKTRFNTLIDNFKNLCERVETEYIKLMEKFYFLENPNITFEGILSNLESILINISNKKNTIQYICEIIKTIGITTIEPQNSDAFIYSLHPLEDFVSNANNYSNRNLEILEKIKTNEIAVQNLAELNEIWNYWEAVNIESEPI